MGAPTALAAVTVSARRGLPQHRGQTPQPAKRNDRIVTCRARFSAAPLTKSATIRNGKRLESHSVTPSLGRTGRSRCTIGTVTMCNDQVGHIPCGTLADARG